MENQPKKPQIMMPAIYKLETRYSHVNHWGWHRASELLEAIQSILVSQGNPLMTANEICARYPHLHPNKPIRDAYPHEPKRESYYSVSSDGYICYSTISDEEWLQRHANSGEYIPAKIGMALINAIKHPIRDRIAKALF